MTFYHTVYIMEFSEIAYKMFIAEFKKYKLFVLCNLFAVAIFYAFISILSNKDFMDDTVVDPMISSGIYAPIYLIILFIFIFIPYAQSVFIKSRQKDYGILLTIGMTENELRKNVLIENVTLCLLYLLSGLLAGTVLSLFFLSFIRYIIGVDGINITISLSAYKITTLYILGIFAISLILNFITMIKSTIYEKIKYTVKAESSRHYSMKLLIVGIVMTILSFLIIILYYHENDNLWFISLFFSIVASILIFSNGEAIIEYFQNRHYKRYMQNLFLFSDLKYYYIKNKKVFLATTWTFFVALFFVMLILVYHLSSIDSTSAYYPFHMTYSEIEGRFEPLEKEEIEGIVHNNNYMVTSYDTVKFLRSGAFGVFSLDDVNRVLDRSYKVNQNSLLYVYPTYEKDGYMRNVNMDIPSVNFSYQEGNREFIVEEIIKDPLFGRANTMADRIILVNEEDYQWISKYASDYRTQGKLHSYNFDNWRNSKEIVNEVQARLFEKNNIEEYVRFYSVSSRIQGYERALQSSYLIFFLIAFVSLLLYFAIIIMIHFKLKMEYKEEQKKFRSLYRIGIWDFEIKKIISEKLLLIFFLPLIYATIINIAYAYFINYSFGYGGIGILFALITSFVFLVIHIVVYKLYFNSYYENILADLDYCKSSLC